MKIIKCSTLPKVGAIKNLDGVARGTGCRFLEVLVGHDGSLIARGWRREKPSSLAEGLALVDLKR